MTILTFPLVWKFAYRYIEQMHCHCHWRYWHCHLSSEPCAERKTPHVQTCTSKDTHITLQYDSFCNSIHPSPLSIKVGPRLVRGPIMIELLNSVECGEPSLLPSASPHFRQQEILQWLDFICSVPSSYQPSAARPTNSKTVGVSDDDVTMTFRWFDGIRGVWRHDGWLSQIDPSSQATPSTSSNNYIRPFEA